jgi:hypothetical protein
LDAGSFVALRDERDACGRDTEVIAAFGKNHACDASSNFDRRDVTPTELRTLSLANRGDTQSCFAVSHLDVCSDKSAVRGKRSVELFAVSILCRATLRPVANLQAPERSSWGKRHAVENLRRKTT